MLASPMRLKMAAKSFFKAPIAKLCLVPVLFVILVACGLIQVSEPFAMRSRHFRIVVLAVLSVGFVVVVVVVRSFAFAFYSSSSAGDLDISIKKTLTRPRSRSKFTTRLDLDLDELTERTCPKNVRIFISF